MMVIDEKKLDQMIENARDSVRITRDVLFAARLATLVEIKSNLKQVNSYSKDDIQNAFFEGGCLADDITMTFEKWFEQTYPNHV